MDERDRADAGVVAPTARSWWGRIAVVAVACALAIAFALRARATAPSGAAPATAQVPQRIVALGATGVYETLIDLGVYDRIVAVGHRNRYPGTESKVQLVTDDTGVPNLEAVLALSPDLVITKEPPRAALEGVGLRVFVIPDEDEAANVGALVLRLGQVLGAAERAEEIVRRMDATVERLRARTRDLPRIRVYYEEPGPFGTHARGAFAHDLLEICGGENVAASLRVPHPVINPEFVVGANPDVIVLGAFTDTADAVAARPGWSGIAAVRNGRVHKIAPDDRLLWSSRWAERAERLLLPWLHPEFTARSHAVPAGGTDAKAQGPR